jgi:hypothetical protein
MTQCVGLVDPLHGYSDLPGGVFADVRNHGGDRPHSPDALPVSPRIVGRRRIHRVRHFSRRTCGSFATRLCRELGGLQCPDRRAFRIRRGGAGRVKPCGRGTPSVGLADSLHDGRPHCRSGLVRANRSSGVVGLVWLHGVAFYLLYVYLTTYLVTVTTIPLATVLVLNTGCMTLLALLIPLMGAWSDRIGQAPLLMTGATGIALLSYPCFLWLTSNDLPRMIAAQVLLTLLGCLLHGTVLCRCRRPLPDTATLYRPLGRLQHRSGIVRRHRPTDCHASHRMERQRLGARLLLELLRDRVPRHHAHASKQMAATAGSITIRSAARGRLLDRTGPGRREIPLDAQETVTGSGASGINAVVVTSRRLLGFSSRTLTWCETDRDLNEKVLERRVLPTFSVVRTDKHLYGFHGANGIWLDEALGVREWSR